MKLVFPPASWWPAKARVARDGMRERAVPVALERPAPGRPIGALQRRAALSPRQVAWVVVALTVLSACVGTLFWTLGAPVVAVFSGLQALTLAAAFGCYALHAADGESLWLDGSDLVVEQRQGLRAIQRRFALAWLQVGPAAGHLELQGREGHCRIGLSADALQRARVLAALRQLEDESGAMRRQSHGTLLERIGR